MASCLNCQNFFEIPKTNKVAKFCDIKCYWKYRIGGKYPTPFFKGHKLNVGRIISKETRLKISLAQKDKPRPSAIGNKSRTGMKNSKEMNEKIRQSHRGKVNYLWKGNRVSHSGAHHWIKREKGKATKCLNREEQFLPFECSRKSKNYHWANISHEYKRDLKDYMELCVPCHKKYDLAKL